MKDFEMKENELKKVNGGDMKGMSTPLGDYPAEELIAMYNNDPQGAVNYIKLAKAFMPGLIPAFKKECEEKGLTIPDGLLAQL